MPLLNSELFVDAMVNRGWRPPNHIAGGMALANAVFQAKPDRDSALIVLETLGEAIIAGAQMHKAMRPWEITPLAFQHLDPNQTWWGFEFETGWRTREARRQALEHVWNTYDGCMFDGEGEGDWQVEITFIPDNLAAYQNGTAAATKFVQWMDANNPLVYRGHDNDVGCHWNVSTPHFRNGDVDKADQLARFLNRTIRNAMSRNGDREELFGRETIYAGFFVQQSGGNNVWLEFKGFRTAYTTVQWDKYVATCTALQMFIDYFFDNYDRCAWTSQAGINLYDVAFNGAELKVRGDNQRPDIDAAPLFSRQYGGENAGCNF
jgi:hypothetical protein